VLATVLNDEILKILTYYETCNHIQAC